MTNKQKAMEQLSEIKAKQAKIQRLTAMVVHCLKTFVRTIPVTMHDEDAVALLKQYLSFDASGRAKVANSKHLWAQTFNAVEACEVRYEWVKVNVLRDEVPKQAVKEVKANTSAWGKDLDHSNTQVREAGHNDFVNSVVGGKKGKHGKSGKR